MHSTRTKQNTPNLENERNKHNNGTQLKQTKLTELNKQAKQYTTNKTIHKTSNLTIVRLHRQNAPNRHIKQVVRNALRYRVHKSINTMRQFTLLSGKKTQPGYAQIQNKPNTHLKYFKPAQKHTKQDKHHNQNTQNIPK